MALKQVNPVRMGYT